VQCEDCQKWFTLPPGVSENDLPDVFECGLRWWDCPHHKNYKGDKEWCKNGKIKTKLVAEWLKILEARRAGDTAQTIEDATVQLTGVSSDSNNGEASNTHLCVPLITLAPLPQAVGREIDFQNPSTQESQPEGASRTRNKELSDVCKFTFYLAQWYAGHVAWGLVQEARIAHFKQSLFDLDKRGKWALFTVDMKGKTVPDKNKCEQGYRMGAKGMSVQGGMFLFCNEHGILQQHFIDLVYEQSSNQSLEEAMSGLAAQLDFIRRQYQT
jgi:hypothetical protein